MLSRTLLLVALLSALLVQTALAQNPAVTIQVDTTQDVHPISPRIYGVNNSDAGALAALNSPINRYGGDRTSRYNWQQNVDNTTFSFFFESFPDAPVPGGIADSFVTASKTANAQVMVTVPMIDFIAKTNAQRNVLCSFSIAKYGPQTGNDAQFHPDCGNGVISNGPPPVFVVNNDPLDANTPNSVAFEQTFVQHLVNTFGTAPNGGVPYYILDNEYGSWHETHRDVHPIGATYDEMKQKAVAYATMIKSVDPGALVVGPEEFGWFGYLFSGRDLQLCDQGNCSSPDRTAHGNKEFVAFFLSELQAASVTAGHRLLDVFTLHYYPQGNGVFEDLTDPATQDLRSRSTRSLWDPTYIDESFINEKIRLIPRMKDWVAANNPGTPLGVTEYHFGAPDHINGGTTQADVLGIFGREGLEIGALFTDNSLPLNTFIAKAFQIYRNYDGQKSTFGDVSIRTVPTDGAATPIADHFGAYGALRSSDGALTLMVVSKYRSGDTPVQVNLTGFLPAGTAQVWRLTSTNVITRLADIALSGNTLSATVPAQSVTLFIVPPGPVPLISIATNNSVYKAGDRMVVTVTTRPGSSNESWYLFVVIATPVNTPEDPFFVYRFNPVELITLQTAQARPLSDAAARPLNPVTIDSFVILDVVLPATVPVGSYQWFTVLTSTDLSRASNTAMAPFQFQ